MLVGGADRYMSVEAISWALNLAPVPSDSRGNPDGSCAAVLVGLANHASPDGTGAFPSVKTLMRYTRKCERTVRTALDRLEATGISRPCDPAIVAAKVKRRDRRPQGWDLDMSLIRNDLDAEDLAVLESQFPGLTARAARGARSVQPRDPGAHRSTGGAAGTKRSGGTPLGPSALQAGDYRACPRHTSDSGHSDSARARRDRGAHETPVYDQRPTCGLAGTNKAHYQSHQQCQQATRLQDVLHQLHP